jgi:type IX secretion system PorP/SprF family membrane protein
MKKLVFLFFAINCFDSISQQIAQFSQFSRNQMLLNPGSAGIYDFVDISMGGRWQWIGVPDLPRTTFLSFSMPLNIRPDILNPGVRTSRGIVTPQVKTGRMKQAIGAQLLSDKYGAFSRFSFSGTYAIHIPLTRKVNLSFGVKAGLNNNSFDSDKAQVLSILNPSLSFDNTYSNFTANNTNRTIVDIQSGLYLYGKDFFVGLSADQLTGDLISFGNSSVNFNPRVHFNLISSYRIKINEDYSLSPSLMLKYMHSTPLSVDFNVITDYKSIFSFGMGYRHTDALIGLIGVNISNMFKVGYSFDISISKLNRYSSGGHELTLGIMLGR